MRKIKLDFKVNFNKSSKLKLLKKLFMKNVLRALKKITKPVSPWLRLPRIHRRPK